VGGLHGAVLVLGSSNLSRLRRRRASVSGSLELGLQRRALSGPRARSAASAVLSNGQLLDIAVIGGRLRRPVLVLEVRAVGPDMALFIATVAS